MVKSTELSYMAGTESDRSLSVTNDFALHYLVIVIGKVPATPEGARIVLDREFDYWNCNNQR